MSKSKRGFASMDKDKARVFQSMGGKTSQANGTAHQFTSEEARAAGRKGGLSRALKRHMAKSATAE